MAQIQITVQDSDSVIATFFSARPEKKLYRSVVVGSGAGISQTYYTNFCHYLADAGFDVMSFDFRGIGQSKVLDIRDYRDIGFQAWAEHDYPAIVNHMLAMFPEQPLLIVGHSAGGWLPGITKISDRIDGILMVAALSGYWRLISAPQRYVHLLAWYVLLPVAIRMYGYWPGRIGMKVDTSAALGLEFARWAKKPGFVFDEPSMNASEHANRFVGDLHLFQIADDAWGTPAAVKAVHDRYPNARTRVLEAIDPKKLNVPFVGHFNFFRSAYRDTLWPLALKRLLGMGQRP
jgi:predicted alpha/beta hydrolase